ncbi:MAG: HD-GYP domain-containing protein [Candidatus Aminicenantales bacterium]
MKQLRDLVKSEKLKKKPANSLILEDVKGRMAVFNPAAAAITQEVWEETGELKAFFRIERVVSDSRKTSEIGSPAEALPWDDLSLRATRLSRAQQTLQSLGEWYEALLNSEETTSGYPDHNAQAFFNSYLIYFIAATDDNEDNVGHSQYVASYARLLARALGIDDKKFLIDLERGALLHDIGKIGLPRAILRKKGVLTALEREIIKEHPLLGCLLLQDYPFLEGAQDVILYHHEWFNGQGYPFGLKGEEIPLVARVFSLADTLDAITSDRPYRKGQPFEIATAEIIKGSGNQFDPSIVDVFLAVPQESWEKAKQDALRTFRLPLIH